MIYSPIEIFLVREIFAILLVFCRVGTAIMLIPGIGDTFVPMRIRLILAIMISYVLAQTIHDLLPPPPGDALTLFLLLGTEILFGVFMGTITRILISTMHTAGMVMASQSSLAAAMLFDPAQGGQSSTIGIFLTIMAITIMFSLDLHYLMLSAFVDSYGLLPAGDAPITHDMAVYIAHIVMRSFVIGFQLGAPVVAMSLLIYLGSGVLSRLMPQMQVFFVIIPAQIMLSFFVIMVVLTAVMLRYTQYVEEVMGNFLTP